MAATADGEGEVAPTWRHEGTFVGQHVDDPDRPEQPIGRPRASAARQGARWPGASRAAAAGQKAAALSHMVAGGGRRRHTREAAWKGEGAHQEDGDGEAKTGRRLTTRIGGGVSRVGVGDGASATPDRGRGAAEGQRDLGS
uniref:Uncharacterized protein n=2 Tax=Oryza sativa subsp. japonica TaxID=39947 RepID=Q7G616_ORYSJ|nr:Hypothetical protein [Oryza sativa Japonica Group]AAN04501.1 Hypothetical protein [Oryza sativa Japonica Group]AAP51932.1 hypothetical protein LOC_Os10g03370 [Oryza sativa Japonica Group]